MITALERLHRFEGVTGTYSLLRGPPYAGIPSGQDLRRQSVPRGCRADHDSSAPTPGTPLIHGLLLAAIRRLPAPPPMSMKRALKRLEALGREAALGGGEERLQAQHERGKLSARERIDLLLDEESFVELDRFVTHRSTEFGLESRKVLGDGVITGYGTIEGRLVHVFSQDFTVFGGSLSEAHAEKIVKLQDMALRTGAPLIGLNDSGGARIQEGVVSLGGYADIFLRKHALVGRVPPDQRGDGPVRGRCRLFSRNHRLRVHGARDELHVRYGARRGEGGDPRRHRHGGAVAGPMFTPKYRAWRTSHTTARPRVSPPSGGSSGTSRKTTRSVRRAGSDRDPHDRRSKKLLELIPDNPNRPYDILDVIREVVDDADFYEVHAGFARNLVTGFAHLGGHSVGIVANQPAVLAGVLDIDSSDKGARFVRFCDAFNIPLVVFEDVPGFLPGVARNTAVSSGTVRKLLYAFCEATVPKVTVITRKAYGGAYDVMNSKHIRGDMTWPGRRGDRGDGPQGRGGGPLPQGDCGVGRPPGRDRGEDGGLPREVRAPYVARLAGTWTM